MPTSIIFHHHIPESCHYHLLACGGKLVQLSVQQRPWSRMSTRHVRSRLGGARRIEPEKFHGAKGGHCQAILVLFGYDVIINI